MLPATSYVSVRTRARAARLRARRRMTTLVAMSNAGVGAERSAIAIGHVSLDVAEVAAATEFFLKLGIRPIVNKPRFAVLELRGGTHLVLKRATQDIPAGASVPFDVMVDDVDRSRRAYAAQGIQVGEIERGKIHSRFSVTTPDGRLLTVTSSHAGDRSV
jgi:catechol 2,3-dioxygenase-like lactoylglutathione lyase family enzyme